MNNKKINFYFYKENMSRIDINRMKIEEISLLFEIIRQNQRKNFKKEILT